MLLVILFACAPPSVDELSESVVRIEARPCGQTSSGTGSVLDDGLVLTNAHLVAGSADDVKVRTNDQRLLEAVVVGFDPGRDLALLHVDGLGLRRVEVGDPEPGSLALIIAHPGSDEARALDVIVVRTFTATGDDIYGEGDVSRTAVELAVDVVPGVSGAGVFDESGELVGVVFADSRRRDEIAYAVAGAEVRAFVEKVDPATPANTQRCR